MKLRPILILLLFVASAAILVWIYRATTRESHPTEKDPWAETVADLDACCRRKHVKSAQYEHFATVANDEKFPGAARLFQAMALSERVQEHNCANVIVRLGGHYTPPSKVAAFRGTTAANLERSIAYERLALSQLHGEDIDRAVNSGNRYAARVLIWAAAGDTKHVDLMERYRDAIRSRHGADRKAADVAIYVVCPECGNLYDTRLSDPYCPVCLTDGRRFVKF